MTQWSFENTLHSWLVIKYEIEVGIFVKVQLLLEPTCSFKVEDCQSGILYDPSAIDNSL